MNKSGIVAKREISERLRSRSFLVMAVLGPLFVLGLIYMVFSLGGREKQHWNVLITDPAGIMENKIMVREDVSITYSFANNYIELEDFAKGKPYQKFDVMLEANEKILSNKKAFLFYREKPDAGILARIHYQFERRLEERVIEEHSKMSIAEFRKLKQPMIMDVRNVYDPHNESVDMKAWVGFSFGALIVIFIFLFGMTILRSISREKSNRIVEVLLASIKPRQLLFGKITGIGISALLQFVLWCVIIAFGLYLMRETIFPDIFDPGNMDMGQLADEARETTYRSHYKGYAYNQFVELVYERINFSVMLGFFLAFFVLAYLFYGTMFACLGSLTGSESDGQQFIIPLLLLLCFALYSGYFAIQHPMHDLTTLYSYLPFTAPVVLMVKLAQGFPEGTSYQLYVSMLVMLVGVVLMLILAARLYRNGILQFGHRLRWKHIVKWLRSA
ncbi:MAG: ABC transporter permease [Bacteroidetes bacterium]|nr:MAG: ABC transporter permease [Bacteroidota bacterium]